MKKVLFIILLPLFVLSFDSEPFCCNKGLLAEIRSIVREKCVFPVDDRLLAKLNCNRLNEGLKKIDPYAKWYSKESFSKADEVTDKIGIGAILTRQGRHYWLFPYKNGPLYKKGVKGRVRLIAIDGHKVDGLPYMRVWKMFLGPVNSMVRLDIVRDGKRHWFYLVRSRYTPSSLEFYKEKGKVVIRILKFNTRQTRIYLQDELARIPSDTDLVIDLQACPGGDLYEALDCAALFLSPGEIMVRLKDAEGKIRDIFVPNSLPSFDRKVRILVGPDTASAAEIFAGILAFYGVGDLEGHKTMGKCTSQRHFVLRDGSVLRLSNLKILFPDGSSCQGRGLWADEN